MSKNRSEVSRWPSRYSPDGWVRADQYIIELVCEAQAKRKRKDLPLRFWNLPEWEKEFKSQLRATHQLLCKFDAISIINVLKGGKVTSLRPKWVHELISKEQECVDRKKKIIESNVKDKDEDEENVVLSNINREFRTTKYNELLNILDD